MTTRFSEPTQEITIKITADDMLEARHAVCDLHEGWCSSCVVARAILKRTTLHDLDVFGDCYTFRLYSPDNHPSANPLHTIDCNKDVLTLVDQFDKWAKDETRRRPREREIKVNVPVSAIRAG